jgi:hypothetical protein
MIFMQLSGVPLIQIKREFQPDLAMPPAVETISRDTKPARRARRA